MTKSSTAHVAPRSTRCCSFFLDSVTFIKTVFSILTLRARSAQPLAETEGSHKLWAGEHFRYIRGGRAWRREVLQCTDLVVLVYTGEGWTPPRLESFQMFALDYFNHGDETGDDGGGCL